MKTLLEALVLGLGEPLAWLWRYACSGRTLLLAVGIACLSMPTHAQSPLPVDSWSTGVLERSALPESRALEYEFEGIAVEDVAAWLEWANIEIPVEVSGVVSGWVWAQRGASGWFSFSDYRVEGEITSSNLLIEEWSVLDARIRFGYREGVWYVGQLRGDIGHQDVSGEIGQADLAVKLSLAPQKQMEASGRMRSIDLAALLQAFDVDVTITNTGGDLVLAGNAPLSAATDLSAWNGQASLDLRDVRVSQLPAADALVVADLSSGAWTITDGQIDWLQQEVRVEGAGRIDGTQPFSVNFSSPQLPVEQLLAELGLPHLVDDTSGVIAFVGHAEGDASQGVVRASAEITAPQIVYRTQAITKLSVQALLSSQQLSLHLKSAHISGGRVSGEVHWADLMQLASVPPESLRLDVDEVEIGPLALHWLDLPVSGVATGQVALSSVLFKEIYGWGSKGELSIVDLQSAQAPIGDARLSWQKAADSEQLVADFKIDENSLVGQLTVHLGDSPDWNFRSTRVVDYRLAGQVNDLSRELRLQDPMADLSSVSMSGNVVVEGTLEQWLSRGTASLPQAQLQLGDQTIQVRDVELQFSPEEIRLSQFRLTDSQGRIAGSAVLRRSASGEHQVNVRMSDFQISPYVKQLPIPALHPLQGSLSLETRLTKDAARPKLLESWTGEALGRIDQLRYEATDLGEIAFSSKVSPEMLTAKLDGRVLGSQAQAQFSVPVAVLSKLQGANPSTDRSAAPANSHPSVPYDPASLNFAGSVVGLQMPELVAVLRGRRQASLFNGTLNLELEGQGTSWENLEFETTFNAPALSYDRMQLAKELSIRTSYHDKILHVLEMKGGVAGGRVEARGTLGLDLGQAQRQLDGSLQFNAQRIQLEGLVGLLLPDYADFFSGVASCRGNLRFDRQISLSGDAKVVDATCYGLAIQKASTSLLMKFEPNGAFASLTARDIHGAAVGGYLQGEASLRGGARYDLKARATLADGKLEQLSQALGFERILGTGRFDGNVDIASRNVSSLNALTGKVQVEIEGGDIQSIPILSDLGRFVPILQLASTDVRDGVMQATIGQGQLRLQRVFIDSNAFWLVADGSASLGGGRLDINALLQAGGGFQQQVAQSALQKLAVGVIPQAALLVQVNDWLTNRSLYFHIGGTTHRPSIQARAAETIGVGILQNVRQQLLVAPAAVSSSSSR
ncbi:AsmA-like C-terminal region-containing protein [Aureliella helgolandensis]|uniref:Putative assembly protein n=1 Tax=Aureliella helgolandensis TaxID=2527968 RepID=A0A518G2J8_9BACT|nr:AsmA-like C-terminal region-containing protein [Aureliella helgolandensis]QDV22812.1 putative assembly protein [Aureliella helgolandensis]